MLGSVAWVLEVGAQRVAGEVLLPQPWDEQIDLGGGVALDTLEHVATVCFRLKPKAALQLLDEATAFLPEQIRLQVVSERHRSCNPHGLAAYLHGHLAG